MKEIRLTIPEGCKTVNIKVDGEQVITEFEPLQNRWRAVKGDKYYFLCNGLQIYCEEELYDKVNDSHYASGNYFKTEEAARRAAQQVREIFQNCNEE